MSSRHLVELPVYFAPQAPQDVEDVPSINPVPRQRPSLEVTTDEPVAAPAPAPVASPDLSAAPEPVRRLGAWQRFLRWWRGY
jgi:hypothetical protein